MSYAGYAKEKLTYKSISKNTALCSLGCAAKINQRGINCGILTKVVNVYSKKMMYGFNSKVKSQNSKGFTTVVNPFEF